MIPSVVAENEANRATGEFAYTMPNLLLAVLDWLILRRRIEAESLPAVRRLRDVLAGSS